MTAASSLLQVCIFKWTKEASYGEPPSWRSALCSPAVVKQAGESQLQRFADRLFQKELCTPSFTLCHYLVPTKQPDLGGSARQS